MDEVKRFVYEGFIDVLAITAVIIAFADIIGKIDTSTSYMWYVIDLSILIIFAIDYFARLILSKDKMRFVKQNIFDLVAIIPFNSFFRAFRLARLARLARFAKIIRLLSFGKRMESKVGKFIRTNGLINIIYATSIAIILGSIGIYLTEKGITVNSFSDAVWWSFVTATTVGYGDISPSTTFGRVIAGVLMLTGIGFIGMLTGTIATYFIKPGVLELQKYHDLSSEDIDKVNSYIEFLRNATKGQIKNDN